MSEDVPPYGDRAAIAKAQAAVAAALDVQQQSIAIAGVMIVSMASALSSKFDTFATWLLAAFGAGVALLLSSHEAATLVSPYAMRSGATLFCWAVVVTVIEKYLAIIVSGAGEAADAARSTILQHIDRRRELGLTQTLHMETIMRELVRPLFRPIRWIAWRMNRKVLEGDLTAGARRLLVIAQLQGFLMLVQIVLFLIALVRIVETLPKS
ncbi:MAG: hypothetical protein ABSE57_34280 [Bryobacteraceae bacterium]